MKTETRNDILRAIEVILLVLAFGFLIPPVPSEAGHVCHVFPGIAFAASFFIAAQCVQIYREKRSWWAAVIKLVLFVIFGWLVFQRITEYTRMN